MECYSYMLESSVTKNGKLLYNIHQYTNTFMLPNYLENNCFHDYTYVKEIVARIFGMALDVIQDRILSGEIKLNTPDLILEYFYASLKHYGFEIVDGYIDGSRLLDSVYIEKEINEEGFILKTPVYSSEDDKTFNKALEYMANEKKKNQFRI